MDAALAEAEAAASRGEVPIGAVLVRAGEIVASAGNRTRELSDPTAHAEMLVIREASARLASERLGEGSAHEIGAAGIQLYFLASPKRSCYLRAQRGKGHMDQDDKKFQRKGGGKPGGPRRPGNGKPSFAGKPRA
ncbi:MAG: deaminase, partial [Pseudomonadota bacterium]|nr:deaminase [Pseudomonadota bacterium]